MDWEWEGNKYSDSDVNQLKVTGRVIDREFVTMQAGRFGAIKSESIIEESDNAKNKVTEWYVEGIGLIKAKIIIDGGGVIGVLSDVLGYGTIEFDLKEIRKQ